jgi:hypothetical protein
MSWVTVHSVAWMSAAAIASWLLIDGFQSGRSFGSRHDNQRGTNPRAYWMSQTVLFLVIAGAAYGLFRTLEGMGR